MQATISNLCDPSMMGNLLAAAVQCARSISLTNATRPLFCAEASSSTTQLDSRAIWALQRLDAGHALRHGMPPVSLSAR